jgi:hypothetical protein
MVRYAKLREALEHCSPQASIPVQSETAPGPLAR